jgi:hypothetical protein
MESSSRAKGCLQNRRFWEKQAGRLKTRLNIGWVLERVRVPILVFGIVAGLALVGMRRGGLGGKTCAIVLGLGGSAAVVWSVWHARRSWVNLDVAFARLDAWMGWNCRLSAARQGVGPWPDPPSRIEPALVVGWEWKRVLVPWGVACLFGLATFWVPPVVVNVRRDPLQRPPAVLQVENLLAELEQNAVLAPENLETFKEQLEQIKNKAPGEWYSHTTLEAAAQLKAEVESGARSVGDQLAALEEALEAPRGAALTHQQMDQLQRQLRDALQGVASAPVGMDRELAKRLSECASKGGVDPKEWADLKQRLQQARECAQCKDGKFKKEGQGESSKTKMAGTEDDGTSEDLSFTRPTELGSAVGEALAQGDLSRALPGDSVNETRLSPKVEPSSSVSGPGESGAQRSGAAAVWAQRPLPPAEQRRLKTFFGN